MDPHYLQALFAPASLVVFAGPPDPARQTPQARALCQALQAQRDSGQARFSDIGTSSGTLADLAGFAQSPADLAVIALPPAELPAALALAGRMACRSALLFSTGVSSNEAENLRQIARQGGLHLLGPNSLGLQRPALQLNASVVGPLAKQGSLGLVSQSGALTASILDWASANAVGFSSVVSLGPHTDVGLAQVLDFLAHDPLTHSIVVYMEGIVLARPFMSALRSAAHAKPVVVLKAGRQPAGNVAAHTHSGAIVGNDDVFDAALRRAGAVRVRSFVELFSAAKCLASRYRPVGKRLGIVTNGGGPGVLAADWANEIGLALASLTDAGVAALQPLLGPHASLTNLLDLGEDASPAHYRAALQAADSDPGVDGLLAIFSPKAGADAAEVARALAEVKPRMGKPLLACWMGEPSVGAARSLLNSATIPSFRTPEAAVGAFGNIASFYQNQQLLLQTPPPLTALAKPDLEGARLLIESVLAERRKVLTEMESKTLLSAFHVPVTQTLLVRSANEAMMVATQLGFPVALKIDSPDITHKSDVEGVCLNLPNASSVRDAYADMVQRVARHRPEARINGVTVQAMARARRGREVWIGLITAEPFGPVIAFGAGGTMIELINDRAVELPPLNQFLARRLIERARVGATLGAWRGASPANQAALEQVMLRVSEMVCELPQLREMDINPLIVDEAGVVAVDARIVIEPAPGVTSSGLGSNYQLLAILPYPARYTQTWPLRDGGEYTVRPIRPDDASMLQELTAGLSAQSRYMRFVSTMKELPQPMLARLTLIDYDREMALVAVYRDRRASNEPERIVGVSRYITNPDLLSCEFSLLVADDFNGRGLGSRLMQSIMDVAREKGLKQMHGLVLAQNPSMLKLMRSLSFAIQPFAEDPDFKLVTHAL